VDDAVPFETDGDGDAAVVFGADGVDEANASSGSGGDGEGDPDLTAGQIVAEGRDPIADGELDGRGVVIGVANDPDVSGSRINGSVQNAIEFQQAILDGDAAFGVDRRRHGRSPCPRMARDMGRSGSGSQGKHRPGREARSSATRRRRLRGGERSEP
jgi:hypothetical protein